MGAMACRSVETDHLPTPFPELGEIWIIGAYDRLESLHRIMGNTVEFLVGEVVGGGARILQNE
jgi:hypothetical protein